MEGGAGRPRSFPEAVACALRGAHHAARTQPHLRIQLLMAAGALLLAAWAGVTALELAYLAAVIGLVLAAELMNTAVEMLTDLLQPDEDHRAGAVKDTAAAAVLVAAILAAAGGGVVLLPHVVAPSPLVLRGLPVVLAAAALAGFLAGATSRAGRSRARGGRVV